MTERESRDRVLTNITLPTRSRWFAIGLLLLLFAQMTTSATMKSLTFDEPLHAARSYVILMTGEWRLQAGHPPLVHRLISPWFELLHNRPDPRSLPGWSPPDPTEIAHNLLIAFEPSLDALIFPLRVTMMMLTMVLGAALYRWAGERHGSSGGRVALLIFAFSPNILAHGRLITTDLALTCFFFLAVYAFQHLLTRPTQAWFIAASLTLGLALGTKVSALLIVPSFALLTLLRSAGVRQKESRSLEEGMQRVDCCIGLLTLTVMVALGVVWLIYGGEVGAWAEGWPALPLPSYAEAVLQVQGHGGERGHPAFFLGKRSGGGWRGYFPIALALKTPLPTLIGAVGGAAWLLHRRRWWGLLTTLVPSSVFLTAAIFSSLNIGYRHILPIVPFFILQAAALVDLPWRRKVQLIPLAGLILWLIAGTLSIHPDYLAYFNELIGGPAQGRHYLTDSNLDWGQDLIQLKDYLEMENIGEIYFSYFGNVNPVAYGIEYKPLPSHFPIGKVEEFTPFSPSPGYYAISVTNLSGQYLIENPSVLDWFNHQMPVTNVGHSINIYHVSPDDSPPKWVGICQAPGVPLDSQTFAQRAGRDDLRFVYFDCRSSWVFADGGEPAWFVVPSTVETEHIVPPMGSWKTVFERENYGGKLLFTVYRWEAQDTLETELKALRDDSQTIPSLPVFVGDNLMLLDYTLEDSKLTSDGDLYLTTYWKVRKRPEAPLSLMAHLVDQADQVVAVGDALGVPIEGWMPGDIILQTHKLELDSGLPSGTYQLQTGAYWLSNVKRLPVTDEGSFSAENAILLTNIRVKTRP